MDIQTQTYVKEYFGVEMILKNKEHPAFEQLQNAVLEVLNENYEAQLVTFNKLFRKQDLEGTGVLNRQKLIKLLESLSLGLTNVQVNGLVGELDPFKTDKVTYSQVVVLLSHKQIDSTSHLLG